jgi:hypothetical protein
MAKVRIICISDTHGQHAGLRLPDGEILIHAGDFMTYGNAPREIIDFNTWLGRQPHAHKIVIAGNHDRLFESHPIPARDLITNATYLEDSGVEVEGLKFWITSAAPVQQLGIQRTAWRADTPPLGQNPDGDRCLGNSWTAFRDSRSIPPDDRPFGMRRVGRSRGEGRAQSASLWAYPWRTRACACSNGCEFVNGSVLNEHYMLVYEPQIVDLEI